MFYILLILLSFFTLPIAGQVVENVPLKEYQEFPQAELKDFSVGNYGFGRRQNHYNPYYYWDDTTRIDEAAENLTFFVSFGSNFNTAGARTNNVQSQEFKDFKNELAFRPNFLTKIWYRYFLFQLSYSNDYLLHRKQTGVNIRYNFDPFDLVVNQQKIFVQQNTLMAALSMITSPSVSLTIGAFSNSFNYTWTPNDLEPVEFRSGLFNNFQYLVAGNFKFKQRWQSYLLFKTQKANVALPEGNLKLTSLPVPFPAAKVSYYGTVGYGIQWQALEKVNLSLEMRHQFLEAVDTTLAAILAGSDERHIWNNEIILGTSFKFGDQLKIGALFSYFLKYDNNLDIRYSPDNSNQEQEVFFARIDHPYSVVVSAGYILNRFVMRGVYQFSKSTHKADNKLFLEDISHFISINLGYNFSL
jgi:hypothetical protein